MMFKDYYRILGLSRTSSSSEIRMAYRNMSMKWHPDKNPNIDVTPIMQDINEAYAILKDASKKARYDHEYDLFTKQRNATRESVTAEAKSSDNSWKYDYKVKDEDLKEDIKEARKKAENMVSEFMSSLKKASKDAAIGAWNGTKGYIFGYVFVSILLSIIGLIIRNFS